MINTKPTILALKKETDARFASIENTQNKMLELLETMSNRSSGNATLQAISPQPVVPSTSDSSRNVDLHQNYQHIYNKFFDPADGFSFKLEMPMRNEKGHSSAVMFYVYVPQKFKSCPDAYWDYYHCDPHSTVVDPGNIEGDIESWCKKVAQNIHYDRNAVVK